MPGRKSDVEELKVVPRGTLRQLTVDEVLPSRNNPRLLFDPEPLKALRDSIREKGVLVPITAYPLKGQDKFGILDGERRYRCCADLKADGVEVKIPANIVDPPTPVAGLLYMFSIHQYRQQWELMPTALSLETVMNELEERDTAKLSKLTGLSEAQLERCKKLLLFPKHFQNMSLDPDPKNRIPSNFWIEVLPVLDLVNQVLPDIYQQLTRDGITQKLVDKYRKGKIKSVIHFRKVVEAYNRTEEYARDVVVKRIRAYILDPDLETRDAFDEFVLNAQRIQDAIEISNRYLSDIRKLKLQFASDYKEDLLASLVEIRDYLEYVLDRLKGVEAPPETSQKEEELDRR
jgi:ParB family transcriptional regulator, chromosome partitioning protein